MPLAIGQKNKRFVMDSPDLLHALFQPPDFYAVIGFSALILVVVSVWTGKLPGRGALAYRAKEPKTFWFGVVLYSFLSAWFLVKFFAESPQVIN